MVKKILYIIAVSDDDVERKSAFLVCMTGSKFYVIIFCRQKHKHLGVKNK